MAAHTISTRTHHTTKEHHATTTHTTHRTHTPHPTHTTRHRYLIQHRYANSTMRKYSTGVQQFINWCKRNDESPDNEYDLDDVLCEYIHWLHYHKLPRSRAANALNGITLYYRTAKGKLTFSWLSYKGWTKLAAPRPHTPMTWQLTVAVATRLASLGKWNMAVATLVLFDGMLRISELCRLVIDDIVDKGDSRMPIGWDRFGLALRDTKTGPRKWATLEHTHVQALLRGLLLHHSHHTIVFDFSPGTFRRWFKIACTSLGLMDYVPHSLRHGAATQMFMLGYPLEYIMRKGRWEKTRTARYYIQEGQTLLAMHRVPTWLLSLSPLLTRDVGGALISAAQYH
jgi:integrase